jgi:hypothetical protein
MGGLISVKSKENEGSTFTFSIKIEQTRNLARQNEKKVSQKIVSFACGSFEDLWFLENDNLMGEANCITT